MSAGFSNFDNRIADALLKWAENHPYPNEPIFMGVGERAFTPMELAHEVEERTEIGKEHIQIFRHLAQADRDLGPEGIIGMLESPNTASA